jgi:hypothetical protein
MFSLETDDDDDFFCSLAPPQHLDTGTDREHADVNIYGHY